MVTQDPNEARRNAQKARFAPEIDRALESATEDIRVWPPDWRSRGSIDYFYLHGSLLVRDAHLDNTQSALSALGVSTQPDADTFGAPTVGSQLLPGLARLGVTHNDSYETGHVVGDLEKRLGVGVATHEHAFTVSYGCGCPATEPEAVLPDQPDADPAELLARLWPRMSDAGHGRDVRVAVVDTGLVEGVQGWAPWLSGIEVADADREKPDLFTVRDGHTVPGSDGFADPYAGHGTFVSGIVRAVAPAAELSVQKYISADGFILESSMISQVCDGLVDDADVISMSAGGYTRNNVPPLSFEQLWETRLSKIGGLVFVAAAGNDATRNPFWPAAFPWCVGVGSMTRDGQDRSWFSNYGSWVDVYAPGEDIVSVYPRLRYKTLADGDERDTRAGIASWSGTSFSTPIVAGLIAARMSQTGENGQEAAASLLAAAKGQFRPGVGPRLFP